VTPPTSSRIRRPAEGHRAELGKLGHGQHTYLMAACSPEARRKISESMRRRWADPAGRAAFLSSYTLERRTAHIRSLWDTPESGAMMRAAVSESQRRSWADPERRASRCAAVSEGTRRSWADPEKRRLRMERFHATLAAKRAAGG